jgi:hypothetical protein
MLAILGLGLSGFGVSGGVGCATLVAGVFVLGAFTALPDTLVTAGVLGALSWGVLYGSLGTLTARRAFSARARGARVPLHPVLACAAGTAIILSVGLRLASSRGVEVQGVRHDAFRFGVKRGEGRPEETTRSPSSLTKRGAPVQMGTLTTCAPVKMRHQQLVPKSQFVSGDRLCVAAEAINVRQAGKIDVVFDYKILSPNGTQLLTYTERYRGSVTSGDDVRRAWVSNPLSNVVPGLYTARVDVRNGLTGGVGSKSITFEIVARPR